jgi:hypothetical protein
MAHELACAVQQASRIPYCCAVKEPYILRVGEYIHIAEKENLEIETRLA